MNKLIVPFRAETLANDAPKAVSGLIGGNLGDLHNISMHEIAPGLFEISGELHSSHAKLQESDDFEGWATHIINDILYDYTLSVCDEVLQIDWSRDYHLGDPYD